MHTARNPGSPRSKRAIEPPAPLEPSRLGQRSPVATPYRSCQTGPSNRNVPSPENSSNLDSRPSGRSETASKVPDSRRNAIARWSDRDQTRFLLRPATGVLHRGPSLPEATPGQSGLIATRPRAVRNACAAEDLISRKHRVVVRDDPRPTASGFARGVPHLAMRSVTARATSGPGSGAIALQLFLKPLQVTQHPQIGHLVASERE